MLRYLKIWWGFCQISFMADIEYRANIVIKVLVDIIWYVAQFSVFEVLYRHTDSIGGWAHDQTRVFMAVLFVVDSIYMVLFHENLDQISWMVKKGDLDLLLTKPVSAQFMVSCKKVNVTYIANILLTSIFLFWAVQQLKTSVGVTQILLFIFSIIFSLSVTYSFRMFFSIFALIFQNAENMTFIWYSLYRFGTRPDSMYPSFVRYALLSFIPVAFIASVPARLIVEGVQWDLFFGGIGLSLLLLFSTAKFWNYALKKYSSASS